MSLLSADILPYLAPTTPFDVSQVQGAETPSTKIAARFSAEKYLLREALLQKRGQDATALPPGFPVRIDSASDWGRDADVSRVTHQLSQDDIKQVLAAVTEFNASGRDLNDLSPDTFALPDLGPRLRHLSRDLHEGAGAVIIQGLDPSKMSLRDSIVAFAGLASFIGDQRGYQSAEDDVLTHLYPDGSKGIKDPRPGLSNHGLPFHNDQCDILALYVVQTATDGGDTYWASMARIYNEIVRTKPQVIGVLAKEDWPHETAIKTTKYLPLLFRDDDGNPFLNFTRFALTGLPTYPRSAHIPDLTPEQEDALDTIEFLAREHAVRVRQHKGDMLFLNNRAALHARGKILDDLAGEERAGRHLVRLCLRDSEFGRSIPPALGKRWGLIFDGKGGKWNLTKSHDETFVSNSKFDALFNDETGTSSHN